MAKLISRARSASVEQLTQLPPNTEIGHTRTGDIVSYGGATFAFRPQQNARLHDFVQPDERHHASGKRWSKFVSRIRDVFVGAKAPASSKTPNDTAGRHARQRHSAASASASVPVYNDLPWFTPERPESIDRDFDKVVYAIRAKHAEKAARLAAAATLATPVSPASVRRTSCGSSPQRSMQDAANTAPAAPAAPAAPTAPTTTTAAATSTATAVASGTATAATPATKTTKTTKTNMTPPMATLPFRPRLLTPKTASASASPASIGIPPIPDLLPPPPKPGPTDGTVKH
ncbi:hypothetical protein [Pandoraea anhela]|uniref:Uncharacterized protein n=1 Tax=Pandoraea anhela TaxID=2508295 RepID=A0A5E4ST21_9BURK|nr:hypothetical protein [Pandoraea anhela]VVD76989.1 hypothetical protein PAN31108_00910 [Pandoraea anhela]